MIDQLVTIVPGHQSDITSVTVSPTESLVLAALVKAIALHGAPTLAEIAGCAGQAFYPTTIRRLLQSLEAKGYVALTPGRARGIRLLKMEE